jgi:hypothetical protein
MTADTAMLDAKSRVAAVNTMDTAQVTEAAVTPGMVNPIPMINVMFYAIELDEKSKVIFFIPFRRFQ